jgi:hypothetical protein
MRRGQRCELNPDANQGGHAHHYSTFAYSELKIVPAAKASGEIMEVAFKVRNTGAREAAEVAHAWIAPAGEYGILVGTSSADIRLQGKYSLAQKVGVR